MTLQQQPSSAPEPASDPAPTAGRTGTPGAKGPGLWRSTVQTFSENRLAVIALAVVILMLLFCYLGPLLHVTDQIHTDLLIANEPPSGDHPLGTDNLGYDVLGRLMLSGQSSLEVGLAAAAVASVFGVLWGAVAGWFGGIVDAVMMRVVDTVLSIPLLAVLLVVSTMVVQTELTLIGIIAAFAWLIPARMVRGEVISLRVREFVQAAQQSGGRGFRIILRHLLPNAIGVIVVQVTFEVANAILAVSALSYLGFGLAPPQSDWGSMLSNGVTFIYDGYWWQYIPAGVAIVLVVMSFNYIGDALRDAFDVRLRQR